MVSGSISALASLTIIIAIRRSNLKLSTIYRRLFYGLIISDLIQSLSQGVLSALLKPKGAMRIAIGNETSCDIVGFAGTLGVSCSVWYSLSIFIYYLCVVKFEMEERKIQKYIEPFLHGIPILFSLIISTYTLSINYFNSTTGHVCWIAPPKNEDGEIEEEEWRHAMILRWVASGGPILFVFVCNCIICATIWWTIYFQSKETSEYYGRASAQHSSPSLTPHSPEAESQNHRNNRGGSGAETETPPPGNTVSISSSLKSLFQKPNKTGEEAQGQGQNSSRVTLFGLFRSRGNTSSLGPLAARLSRPSRTSMRLRKEISSRVTAFIIGYILTYMFSVIGLILLNCSGNTPPFAIIILARFFLPLQGE